MKTTITLLIAASLAFNSLVSLGGLELPAQDALESAVAVEFTVLSFLSVSSLPFRILNDIAAPAGLGGRKKPSSKEKKQRKDAPDRSLPFYEANAKGADQGKGALSASVPCLAGAAAVAAGGFWSHLIRGVTSPPGMFLLSYLVILSRSNLPWETVPFLPVKSPVPVKAEPGFSFGARA